MKIKHIEIQEKQLTKYRANKREYLSVTEKWVTEYEVQLIFAIPDDFDLIYNESISLTYNEFEFGKDVKKLDSYIVSLKRKLDEIILKNGTK